jgi:hypothetical protein
VDLDRVDPEGLEDALALFPHATRVVITGTLAEGDAAAEARGWVWVDEAEMMRVLEERGRSLRTVETINVNTTPVFLLSYANRLPSLQASSLHLRVHEEMTSFRRGLLVNLMELSVDLGEYHYEYMDIPDVVESLEHLQLCPLLARLTLKGPNNYSGFEPDYPWDEWPLVIPASVRHLHLVQVATELLWALPTALRDTEPALETLEVMLVDSNAEYQEWGDVFAEVLPLCAASLRHVSMRGVVAGPEVAPSLATCHGLERLEVPIAALGGTCPLTPPSRA